MIESCRHAAVACRHVLQVGRQQVQSPFHLLRDVTQRQRARPTGRQLDGQRHPFQQAADADDLSGVSTREAILGEQPAQRGKEEGCGVVPLESGSRVDA